MWRERYNPPYYQSVILLAEVALQQTSEAGTMTGLVLGHFVYGVVDGIETGSLGVLGNTELILASTSLGSSTLLKIGLGVPYNLAQQLSETRGVVGLLEGIALEGLGNLGITLTVSLTSHCQIHTNLTTLTIKVCTQVVDHFLTNSLGLAVTNLMNGSISHISIILQFRELRGWSLTDRTLLGGILAFIDISTNGANKLFLHNV